MAVDFFRLLGEQYIGIFYPLKYIQSVSQIWAS